MGEIPRDSVTAQTSSWFWKAAVEAPVLGRAVEGRPALLRPVRGRDVVVVLSLYEMKGYEPLADAYEVDAERLGGAICEFRWKGDVIYVHSRVLY